MNNQKTFINKILKYSIVGIICTAIYFLFMFVCIEILCIQAVLASVISFIVMTFFSFFLNKKYTFGGIYTHTQFVKFTSVSSIGFVLNFSLMYLIVTILSFHYLMGEFVTILVIPIVNFLLNNFWTFR